MRDAPSATFLRSSTITSRLRGPPASLCLRYLEVSLSRHDTAKTQFRYRAAVADTFFKLNDDERYGWVMPYWLVEWEMQRDPEGWIARALKWGWVKEAREWAARLLQEVSRLSVYIQTPNSADKRTGYAAGSVAEGQVLPGIHSVHSVRQGASACRRQGPGRKSEMGGSGAYQAAVLSNHVNGFLGRTPHVVRKPRLAHRVRLYLSILCISGLCVHPMHAIGPTLCTPSSASGGCQASSESLLLRLRSCSRRLSDLTAIDGP